MPDSTLSTLDKIRIKVRRLSRSPSPSQISDSEIDEYINTFVLYDFPEHMRMFYLRQTLTFYTRPNVDTYSTNTTVVTDPLYNFKNRYLTTASPVYIAGVPAYFTQSREQFYGIYPKYSSIQSIGTTGNGILTNFTGTLSGVPVLANNVVFDSIDINGNGLVLADDGLGNLLVPDGVATVPASTINYLTGAYVLNFPVAPMAAAVINSQTYPFAPSRPSAMLYYSGDFILRPVPDQPYAVNLEVFVRPSELLTNSQQPELAEWAQYIAYGATKKIFEDRMDQESVQIIMPEFHKQELLILRRTLVQNSNQRTATIYTEQAGIGTGFNWSGNNF